MNTLKTLLLFTILAILAAYVYFYEVEGGKERDADAALAEKIIDFEPDSVKTIEIRSLFGPYVFARTSAGWDIREPVNTGGDKTNIDGLLTTLKNLKKDREFAIKRGEEKNYGLVGRSFLVTLEFNNGQRDSVRFGDETPVGGKIFISKGDSLVYTVVASAKSSVNKQLFDWRDKSLAKLKLSDVMEFKIKNSHGLFQLQKEGNNWELLTPRKVRADNGAVDAVLRKFENGKALSVASEELDNPRTFNLQRPAYQVDLYLGEAKSHKQLILSRVESNRSYLKDDSRPQVMTVDSLFIRDIDKSFFDLRYKKICEFPKDDVDRVVVTQGDSLITFEKDTSNTWIINGTEKVKSWKMNSFLNTLANLQAKQFLIENTASTAKFGLGAPQRKITCFSRDEMVQTVLLNTDNNRSVAFSPVTQIVAEIEKNSFNNLEVKPQDFIEENAVVTAEGN